MKRLLGLEKSHPDLAEIVDQLNLGLLARSPDGTVVFANQRICSWLGYEPHEILAKSVEMLVPPEAGESLYAEMGAVEAGDVRVRLTVLQRRDSTTFPVVLIPTPFFDDEDKFSGVFVAVVELASIQTAWLCSTLVVSTENTVPLNISSRRV